MNILQNVHFAKQPRGQGGRKWTYRVWSAETPGRVAESANSNQSKIACNPANSPPPCAQEHSHCEKEIPMHCVNRGELFCNKKKNHKRRGKEPRGLMHGDSQRACEGGRRKQQREREIPAAHALPAEDKCSTRFWTAHSTNPPRN
jgi:hypothetical protein